MKRSIALSLALLPLAGCSLFTTSTPPVEEEQTSSVAETKNVIYRGTLLPLGASIYMEGTHRLELEDGRFVLLEADGLILDDYLAMDVEVFGATRPTVEGGGIIMRVERVAEFVESSEASSATVTLQGTITASSFGTCEFRNEELTTGPVLRGNFDCNSYHEKMAEVTGSFNSIEGGTNNVFDVISIRMIAENSSSAQVAPIVPSSAPVAVSRASVAPVVPSSAPPAVSSAAPVPVSSSSSSVADDAVSLRAAAMAKANMDSANWTQRYCSTHTGFCFPVHKNWWYTSFGATSSSQWHVELSSEEIVALGDGPLSVVLVAGAAPAADGQVTVENGRATGIRAWTNNRHFVISAPAVLETAVRYVTQELTAAPASSAPGAAQ